MERIRISSLFELDALVGRHLTGEQPETHWEDSHAQLRFDSIEEALEALHDPYFQQFIPADDRPSTVLREVREFRNYSSDLELAWEVVQALSVNQLCLHIRRERSGWSAAFGDQQPIVARTTPLAICLAALRSKGVEVVFEPVPDEQDLQDGSQTALRSLFQPGTLAD